MTDRTVNHRWMVGQCFVSVNALLRLTKWYYISQQTLVSVVVFQIARLARRLHWNTTPPSSMYCAKCVAVLNTDAVIFHEHNVTMKLNELPLSSNMHFRFRPTIHQGPPILSCRNSSLHERISLELSNALPKDWAASAILRLTVSSSLGKSRSALYWMWRKRRAVAVNPQKWAHCFTRFTAMFHCCIYSVRGAWYVWNITIKMALHPGLATPDFTRHKWCVVVRLESYTVLI